MKGAGHLMKKANSRLKSGMCVVAVEFGYILLYRTDRKPVRE